MRSDINHILAALAAMAAFLFGMSATDAHAQIISNIATIQWDAGPNRIVRNSNQVSLVVEHPPPTPANQTFYQLQNAQGSQQLSVPTTLCQGSAGPTPVTLNGAFSGISLAPASVLQTAQIRAGAPVVVAIDSVADNLDPALAEAITIQIRVPSGDSETLSLTESGPNTGRFVGLVPTSANPATPVSGDCVLTIAPGTHVTLTSVRPSLGTVIATSAVDVLIDPFGMVFDSGDGSAVAGTSVTLIDADTGQPAQVFGDDGVSSFPSTIVTGSTVTDGGGNTYIFPPGDYRFPFAKPGNYRLLVQPPTPYTVPSTSTPADLAGLRRPDGQPFALSAGSYGNVFVLSTPAPVRIDIPADRPGGTLLLRKSASSPTAVPGDPVQYRIIVQNADAGRTTGAITVTDLLPAEMRLKQGSVRYNGSTIAYAISPDGRNLSVGLPPLAAGSNGTMTYILEIRPDAKPGVSLNRASARDNRGAQSPTADASVRILRDGITDRMTIIGRITDGGCMVDPDAANGVPGVRVMLEDGSYAVTDIEGRYHFEGVVPGLHVVQIDPSSLPSDQIPADCANNARSAGSAISRFVDGRGGSLMRVDFRTTSGRNTARQQANSVRRLAPSSDAEAAGADRDWFSGQMPEIGWLFPSADHNPRTKAVRIVIKHLPDQSVRLLADGKPVDDLAFEGARKNGVGSLAVSQWRAVELKDGDTAFTAEVRDANGALVETLHRTVHYANSALHAALLPEKSVLIADGVTRPVIALRMTDRAGLPVRNGLVGDFSLPAPYYPAVEADAQAARQLSGLERARPVWHVEGDEGIAYVELEPTTASGGLSITLPFRDGDVTRKQTIQTWLTPGKRPWTIVGFAAGTAGFNTLKGRAETLGASGQHWYSDARLALYAKGRIKGKWLMTLAFDSDKDKAESRFGGTIDPTAYYTIYADRSERRYDASSVRKLYLKLERPQFYALFGDYETGINEPQLTRYQRAFNGAKAEFGNDHVRATAFAADTPYRHRREEIQGNGLTGPYALGAHDIMPNSERVLIETRDRLRSDRILESRALVRHIDYDIDYVGGTLRFREPILSRSSQLDPQFIIVDYEVDGVGQRVLNAGGRASWTNDAKTLMLGGTVIHDESDIAKTNMGGVDVRYTPNASTEVRAEFARSNASGPPAGPSSGSGTATAWLVEAEHHGKAVDLLAYAREQQAGFGVGQTNGSEAGTRKFGADGRIRITPDLSITGSAWNENYLGSAAQRSAGRALAEYRTHGLDLRAGVTVASDRLDDGRTASSTIAQFGVTKRFLENRLELDGQTELPVAGKNESIDFPARHKFSARFAVTDDVTLVGSYEIAKGDAINARTARIGFDLKPWTGARLVASANQQASNEYGARSFAAYGLSQSLPVSKTLTVDMTLDGNKTLGGIDPARVLNPLHPVTSGGFVGSDGSLTEDFTAVTGGATYRGERWSLAGRAEYRDGQLTNRYGLTLSGLRQIGEGRAFGGALTWFRAVQRGGPRTDARAIALSWANRPDDSRFAFLEKFELRDDRARGAIAGMPGPIGGPALTINGDATSRRIVNSFSLNWSPTQKREDGTYLGRSEISAFWGTRYVFDRFGADDLKGWSNVVGADIRFDLGKMFDVGVSGTVRQNPGGRSYAGSGGPTIGISPMNNTYISVGYNIVGFHDRDFEASRYTRSGPFVTVRLKFDQNSFSALGLGRR
ncbi:MAG: hypothetical protein U1E64_11860 [Sphingomonadaceae bacterium]